MTEALAPEVPVMLPEAPAKIRIEGVAHTRVRQGAHEGWVGEPALSITSDFMPGCAWLGYCALALQEGQRYRAEVFEWPALDGVPDKDLPRDRIVKGVSVEFYATAKSCQTMRWPADRRKSLPDLVGVWTDGLMVATAPGENSLQRGKAYRIVVRALADAE